MGIKYSATSRFVALVRAKMKHVFRDMIAIAFLQDVQDIREWASLRQVHANLEVEQVRRAVVVDKDVVAFV